MKIHSAEFIRGATRPEQWPTDGLPEIAFAGRSNVGKSSLINSLTGRKKLAVVSKTPGRTRQINFFHINGQLYFVDLPGYGFANVSKKERASWGRMIETYLGKSPHLAGVVVILDIRRTPSDDDIQMLYWCRTFGVRPLPVLTKADKLSRNQRAKQKAAIAKALADEIDVTETPLVLFSAKTGEGRRELLGELDRWAAEG
jgi:GTP-binding protein